MRLTSVARVLLQVGLLTVTVQTGALAAEPVKSEPAIIALASTPGPRQADALEQLGRHPPKDAVAVAKALVEGLVGKDITCQIMAERSAESLLRSFPEKSTLAAPLAKHADRLLSAAESRMTELTNPPLVVLGQLNLDSGTCSQRLLALLAPGKKFRQNTISALANCRPLTPEIKRASLAEATGDPLTQQNLAFAMGTWPATDLVGEEVDRALSLLLDAIMGNIPPLVIGIVKQRAQASPILAAKLLDLAGNPTTPDDLFSVALSGYPVCAGEAQELILLERLVAQDPHQDPDRFVTVVFSLIGRKSLSPALIVRLSILLKDDTQTWWLRHQLAKALTGKPIDSGLTSLVAERSKEVEWVVEAESATGWPQKDIDNASAKAATDEERTTWTIIKMLGKELAAHENDPDINQRSGAIQAACVARWVTAHPDAAWQPSVVEAMLHGYTQNYAPTPNERAQCLAYVTALIQHGFFTDVSLATMRYPQNAPMDFGHLTFQALTWALEPDRRRDRQNPHDSPLIIARLEATRRLHAAKAPPILVMHAERELASIIRSHIREVRVDPGIFREDLKNCGFSLVPVQTLLDDAAKR